jgi:hypothetical protein
MRIKVTRDWRRRRTSSSIFCSSASSPITSTISVTSSACFVFKSRPSYRIASLSVEENVRIPTSSRSAVRHFNRVLKSPFPSTLRSLQLALTSEVVRPNTSHLSHNSKSHLLKSQVAYSFSSSVSNASLFTVPSKVTGSELLMNSPTPAFLNNV